MIRITANPKEILEKLYLEHVTKALLTNDHKYLVCRLLLEKSRIKTLVPSLKDFHENLDAEVDIKLIQQILENGAFSGVEFFAIMNAFLKRIEELEHPHDENERLQVQKELENIGQPKNWGEIAPYFLKINKLIDIADKRRLEALRDPQVIQLRNYLREKKLEKSRFSQ